MNLLVATMLQIRVAMVREKSGKNKKISKSGKSQGIFLRAGKILEVGKSQGIFILSEKHHEK